VRTRAWNAHENPTFEVRTPDGEVVWAGKGFYFLRTREAFKFADGDYEQYRSHDDGLTWSAPLHMRTEHGRLKAKVCPGTIERKGGYRVPCCKAFGHDGPC
jgi:hypothetical protein